MVLGWRRAREKTRLLPPQRYEGAVARSWSGSEETQRRLGEKLGAEMRREPQHPPANMTGRAMMHIARRATRRGAEAGLDSRAHTARWRVPQHPSQRREKALEGQRTMRCSCYHRSAAKAL